MVTVLSGAQDYSGACILLFCLHKEKKCSLAAKMKWLVVDTDAGIDDAVAVCLALRCAGSHGFTVKLITTSYGTDIHFLNTSV